MKEQFLLDFDVTHLNHGSFGATPRGVFATYQAWQRRLEQQPVYFMEQVLARRLHVVRERLGDFLGCDADEVVCVPNATHGVNIVARSLALQPGDEVLTSNHEYGACDNGWQAVCAERGAIYKQQPIRLAPQSNDELIEQLFANVSERTRVLYLSHITSATALTFPVAEICRKAAQLGLITVIDGAHAPGQLALDLHAIGADFYIGNLHKWVLSPKGAAFLYARRERQPLLRPLVASWDWANSPRNDAGSPFLNRLQWQGTNDPAAYFAVPAALDFIERPCYRQQQAGCRRLVGQWRERMAALTGYADLYGDEQPALQMAIARLPQQPDLRAFKELLYNRFRIEIPCFEWNGCQLIRLSLQVYNDAADVERLLAALAQLLAD